MGGADVVVRRGSLSTLHRHIGHDFFRYNHCPAQLLWKVCLHWKELRTSKVWKSFRQIAQRSQASSSSAKRSSASISSKYSGATCLTASSSASGTCSYYSSSSNSTSCPSTRPRASRRKASRCAASSRRNSSCARRSCIDTVW